MRDPLGLNKRIISFFDECGNVSVSWGKKQTDYPVIEFSGCYEDIQEISMCFNALNIKFLLICGNNRKDRIRIYDRYSIFRLCDILKKSNNKKKRMRISHVEEMLIFNELMSHGFNSSRTE